MCYVFPPCLLTFRTLCTKTSIISGFQGRRFSVLSSVQGNGGTILSSNHIYAAEAIDGDTWAFFQAACCLGFLFFLLLLYRYPEWDVPKRLRWPGWILSYNPGLYLFARECICFFFSKYGQVPPALTGNGRSTDIARDQQDVLFPVGLMEFVYFIIYHQEIVQ